MRRSISSLAVLAALFVAAPVAQAGTVGPAPFGHACTAQDGVRFCPTADASNAARTVNGVKTFDGVPLDADVTLPASGNGPFPTIVMLHGYGGTKKDFESSTPESKSSTSFHYNNNYYAKQGYAVLNYTARGFGHSCGGGPSADHTGDCAQGYIRLADSRYEARDTQYLVGRLADQGIVKPGQIGVTGISYGGGQSMELAFLKDRIRLPDHSFAAWKSPKGTPLAINASWPRWPWSDLASSLLPNGRFLDFDSSTNGLSRDPVGVPIQSYVNGLFVLGLINGYYCGSAPGGACASKDFDLPGAFAEVLKGEPISDEERGRLKEITADKGGYALSSAKPSPLLIQNGWTDDLFPPAEGLRIYNAVRSHDPRADISMQFGDLGHSRGSNKTKMNTEFNTKGASFFAAHLRGAGQAPKAGSVETFTQTCPAKNPETPDGGPFSAASWPAIHPGRIHLGGSAAQTVASNGDTGGGPEFDPITETDPRGTSDACRTVAGGNRAGTASYTRTVTSARAFTLLGLPTVTATIKTAGQFGQLDSRLYDVLPDGTERLVSRGTYRLLDNQAGKITFQLHGNGYRFEPGHKVKLELRGNDTPYYRASNGSFSVQVSHLVASLPSREKFCDVPRIGVQISPTSTRQRVSRRYRLLVTSRGPGCTAPALPFKGALIRFGGRQLRSDGHGRASVVLVLHRHGRYRVTATAAGHSIGRSPGVRTFR